MAEVGLASAIVTFLDVSVRVVSRLAEYHATAKDAPGVFQRIERELPVINDFLQRTKLECDAAIAATPSKSAAAGPSSGAHMAADSAQRLAAVVAGCHKSVERLETLLGKALRLPSDSRTRRSLKAVSSLWYEREINEVERQLAQSLQVLQLNFKAQLATQAGAASRSVDVVSPQMEGLYEVPSMRLTHMVRRPLLLEQLDKHFSGCSESGSSADTAVTRSASDEPTVVVLLGLGGQGKTQLALEYCKMVRASGRFDTIVWLDASSAQTAQRGFEQLASKIAPSQAFANAEAKVSFVKERLAGLPKPWLMVFDNYDQPDDFPAITSYFPSPAKAVATGAILVTSRHASTERLGSVIDVTGMTEHEALELLLRQTKSEKSDSTIRAGQEIVRRLGYLPLAIDQAGAYIGSRKLPLDRFLEQYHERRAAVLKHTPPLWEYRRKLGDSADETPLSVFTTWELSFGHLRCSDADRVHLRRFLTVASHYDITGVHEAIFAAYGDSETKPRPQWMELFTSAGGEWDHDKFETVVVELSNLSLLHIVATASSAVRFSLHPLVADWIRLQALPETRETYALEAMVILSRYVATSDYVNVPSIGLTEVISHVDAHLRCVDDYLLSSGPWGTARVQSAASVFAKVYWRADRLDQSLGLLRRVLDGRERALGPDHTSTLVTAHNLGLLYSEQGKLVEAEEMYQRALNRKEKALGPDHTSTLDTVHNLGTLYSDQGKLVKAEEMYRRALTGYEKALGPDHTSTLNTVNNLGLLYRDQGKLVEAEAMYQRALNRKEKALGPDHTSTLNTVNNLGLLYRDQGKLVEAEEMLRRALTGYEKALGPDHTSTLQTVNNLGLLYRDQGKLVEAEEMLRRALTGIEKALGPDHRSTLATVFELGCLYVRQGRHDDGRPLLERAIAGFEKVYGPSHRYTLAAKLELDHSLRQP